jgi:serine protease Do
MYDPLRSKAKVVFYTVAAFVVGLGVASGLGWTSASLAMPVIDGEPQVSREAVQPALDLSEAFVNVSEVVTPAVVRVQARRPAGAAGSQLGPQSIPDPLRRFFEPDLDRDGEQLPPQGRFAGGSGFLVSADGYILTNDHVVAGADQLTVAFPDRRSFTARLVGTDPFTDVAVLKIDVEERLPTLSFGDSDDVRVGEWVLAIGNPGFGSGNQLDYTVTAGIVSARGRGLGLINNELQREGLDQSIAGYAIEDYIQTDAVINPGNSGGPMVDLQGRVLGINSAIASSTGFYQGYGFAIPINLARRVMEDLIEYGHVRRPQLGVFIGEIALEDAEVFGLPSVSGVLVQEVTPDGPAEAAGLRMGDVIVAIEDKPVGYMGQLQGEVAMYRPGDRIELTAYRDGEPRDFTVRLGEAPISDVQPRAAARTRATESRLGIVVQELTPEVASQFGYAEPGGVVITQVQIGSPAQLRNLGRGLKITEINGRPVDRPEDVGEILGAAAPGSVVQFIVENRAGSSRIVNVRVPAN